MLFIKTPFVSILDPHVPLSSSAKAPALRFLPQFLLIILTSLKLCLLFSPSFKPKSYHPHFKHYSTNTPTLSPKATAGKLQPQKSSISNTSSF